VPTDVPDGGPGADLLELLNSRDFYTVYPPLSQEVFYVGSVIGSSVWAADYYAIKLIILLIEFLGVLILAGMVSGRRAVLYAWNPVVVIEVAGQGHTEGLAVGLVLLGVLLLRHERYGGSAAAITAAGMVKLVPFLALPFVWRKGGWLSLFVSMAVGIVIAFPYLNLDAVANAVESLRLYVSYFEFNAGLYYVTKWVFELVTGTDQSKFIGPMFGWLFVLALPVIYYLDFRHNWSLERALIVLLSAFFLLSTTLHPWYVVPLLGLLVLEERIRWHWYWMSILSSGTYLLYVGGPYELFVGLTWSVWAFAALAYHRDSALQWIQRRRAASKFAFISDWIEPRRGVSVLDLGAGEGYVGVEAQRRLNADVKLADVVDLNRTGLPFSLVGPGRLGFESDSFDYVILYFVLHHAEDPVAVVTEAARVARHGVVVVESVYETPLQLRLLGFLDRFANRIRSGGRMRAQEEFLHFRKTDRWRQLFEELGLRVERERAGGNWIHRQAAFLVSK
ncbi:MAG: methyltransferase domain-containing protein, partial [Rhodothermales bacterium]|nr:methyltransferase domain-containing protein [Rhodothermales bacterium]